MKVFLVILFLVIITAGCKNDQNGNEHLPNRNYHYAANQANCMASHIYGLIFRIAD